MSNRPEKLHELEEENRRLRARILELDQGRKREALELAEQILDSSQDLIAALDTQFRYLAFNSSYQRVVKRLFGAEVRTGCRMPEALARFPEDRDKAVALWERALQGEAFTVTEVFHGMGEPRYFEGHWHPLRSRDGEIVGASHIVRDVTERVRAEQALRLSEAEFKAFFDNAAVGAVQLDASGRFIGINDRFCKITGYSREELLEKTPFDITHPEDRQRDFDGFLALMRGERTCYEGEKRYMHKDGRSIWVQLTAGIIRDMAGRPLRSASIIQDVSDRRAAEEKLRTLAAVVENGNDFICLATSDMKPFFINEAGRRMVGLTSPEEVSLTEVQDYIWPEDWAYFKSNFPCLIRQGRWSSEIRLRHLQTGAPVHVRWNVFRIRNEAGTPLGWATVGVDISQRKQMEEELRGAKKIAEEASRAKSEFLANMSHELRTPMTVIMSSLELLRSSPLGPQESRQFIEMADVSAHRLLAIIEDLLDISRIEAGQLRIDERPFVMRDCVAQSMEMCAPLARKKGLQLLWSVAPSVPELMQGDPDRIGQVLLNLVGNAVKFTESGEVTVTVADRPGGVDFTVRDTGIGIPREKRGLLFQPFTQVDSSITRRHGGTGLGLAICRELVGLMGGTIGVASEEGRGSTFTFTLPLRPAGAPPVSPAEDRLKKVERAVRILVAEDDPMVQDMITIILEQRGFQVETAESGRVAVEKSAEAFDIILMDLQMPEMNGIEATHRIRRREAEGGGRTAIIGLTAHARRETIEECLASGMDQVLTKPVRMKELYSAIDEWMGMKEPPRRLENS